jgi:hypothetical protein
VEKFNVCICKIVQSVIGHVYMRFHCSFVFNVEKYLM